MRSYRRGDFHTYTFKFHVKGSDDIHKMDIETTSIEDAMVVFDEEIAVAQPKLDVAELLNVECDGKPISQSVLSKLSSPYLAECDGGACAGGDAGGAVAGGDAGVAADVGDIAGEMAGTTTAEVLGTNKPGEGYFGKGNFYIPSKVKTPLHRWELANGGSKRKKGKNGKPKKYDYEKGMKVVVAMFEDDDEQANNNV